MTSLDIRWIYVCVLFFSLFNASFAQFSIRTNIFHVTLSALTSWSAVDTNFETVLQQLKIAFSNQKASTFQVFEIQPNENVVRCANLSPESRDPQAFPSKFQFWKKWKFMRFDLVNCYGSSTIIWLKWTRRSIRIWNNISIFAYVTVATFRGAVFAFLIETGVFKMVQRAEQWIE